MKFVFSIVFSLCILSIYGQSDCSIKVANEMSDDIIVRSGALYNHDNQDIAWSLDTEPVTLTLDSGEESSLLAIERFNVDIPDGSQLLGVSIMIRGSASGGNIRDRVVSITTEAGDSANFANFVSYGDSWNEEVSTWTYGTSYNLLNGPITIEDLRSDNYSINLKIANAGIESSEVSIEDVSILVRYRLPYTVCPDHLCVIFYVPDVNPNSQYEWTVPDGFELLDNQNGIGVVGIIVQENTANGLYEICVDEVIANTELDQCCRTFALADCQPNSIGDAVYLDENQNGVFDSDEAGLPSVSVNLLDDENNLITTTTTDVNGNYRFDNLEDGYYQIEIDYDGALSPSFESSFSEFVGGLRSEIFYLQGSQFDDSLDFGFFAQFSISGLVWTDENCNGLFDSDEIPLSGLPVVLFDGVDNLVATTLSDADGYYEFDGLISNTYSVWLSGFDTALFEPALLVDSVDGNSLTIINGAVMTEPFLLVSNTTKNLGISAITGTIIGETFVDANGDNVDDGDAPLSGVDVLLWSCDGKAIGSTQTDESGNYSFDKVPVGEYYVEFGSLGDFNAQDAMTTLVAGNNDITSANGLHTTDCFAVSADLESNISAGYFEYASIGDFIWEDTNENGLQDPQEMGVNGVNIQLYTAEGNLVAETTSTFLISSNTNGHYKFDLLTPGEYYIQVDSDEIEYSPVNTTDTNINSDITGENGPGTTSTVTLLTGENNLTIDLGIISNTGQISGYLFDDVSGNGYSEEEDFGIANVTLTAIGDNGLEYLTQTDENGNYLFNNVADGDYTLTIQIDERYNLTDPNIVNDESNDTNDSDFLGSGNLASLSLTLVNGESIVNVDAGFYRFGTISGLVWEDTNQNGIRETTESVTDAYTVKLRGDFPEQVLTLTNGAYTASNLRPGTYNILVEAEINVIFAPAKVGNDSSIDSDIELLTDGGGSTRNIFIESGTQVSHVDAGLYLDPNVSLSGTLSGRVFLDNFADGTLVGDSGIADIEVAIVNSAGEVLSTILTDLEGNYQFDNLEFGTYTIQVATQEYSVSNTDIGTNNSIDSDFSFNGNNAFVIATVTSVNSSKVYDLGLYELGSINGTVWFDNNDNGIRDLGDDAIPGYVVTLNGANGIDETFTDGDGVFVFADLIPGIYNVSTTAEGDVVFSATQVGSDTTIDSDIANIDGTVGSTTNLFINSGSVQNDIGIGLMPGSQSVYSITGTLYNDVSADGIQSVGDMGESQVDLILFDQNENFVSSTLTDNNGNYAFNNLAAGAYILRIISTRELTIPNVGTDDTIDSDFGNISSLYQVSFTLSEANPSIDLDAGLYGLGVISGVVWEDEDENGIRDTNEGLLIDQEVRLLNSNQEIIATTLTDTEGYLFDGLQPGIYSVQYVLSGTFAFTQVNTGLDSTVDSDILNIENNTGRTANQFIFSDSVNDNVDIGLTHESIDVGAGSISGVIFEDRFANNIQDSDPGIQFISVNLVDSDGMIVDTQITDTMGAYLFDNVPVGSYTVTYLVPEIYTLSLAGLSINEMIDVDFTQDDEMAVSDLIILTDEDEITHIDSGMWRGISIGGVLWNDLNANGVRNLDEPLLAEYPVRLYDVMSGDLISTTVSTAIGYLFENIRPGGYYIGIPITDSQTITQVNVGNDDTSDSEFLNSTGDEATTSNFFLESGTDLDRIDGGLIFSPEAEIIGTVGGIIFEDNTANSIQDGDQGVEGVLLDLVNVVTGSVVQTVNSSITGQYTFANVPEGQYYIELQLPEDYILAQPDVGSNDAIDSDFAMDSNGNISSEFFTIDAEELIIDIDAGMYTLGQISGVAWIDDNVDGIRNLDDMTVAGLPIHLIQDGMIVQTSMSTITGFEFQGISPGIYSVGIELNTQLYEITEPLQGNDTALDSDIINTSQSLVNTGNLFIQSGSEIEDIGIGLISLEVELMDITLNTVFFEDLDGDGLNFESVPYLADEVTVSVVSTASGTTFFNQTFTEVSEITDLNIGLLPGDYQLVITSFASLTQQDIGGNEDRDSDFSESENGSYQVDFMVEGMNTQFDFTLGVYDAVTISGRAWNDNNSNGLQDEGEEQSSDAGVGEVLIILNNGAGAAVATMTTLDDGEYRFDDLAPGNYRIGTLIPDGLEYTDSNAGVDSLDSDIVLFSGINGSSALFNLLSGEELTTLDIGVVGEESESPNATLTGTVWEDLNANGVIDFNEPLINDVDVYLHDNTGSRVEQTKTSNSPDGISGFYLFELAEFGEYFVSFDYDGLEISTEPFVGASELLDSDVTHEIQAGATGYITVNSAKNYGGVNFGYYFNGSIGDYIWYDENQNGIQENGENGIGGIQVILMDDNGNMIQSAYSSESNSNLGRYAFEEVMPGRYTVAVNTPEDLTITIVGAGNNELIDNNINSNTEMSSPLRLDSGQAINSIDIGLYEEGSSLSSVVGDQVFIDINGDNVYNTNEPGLNDVKVELFTELGDLVSTTTTQTVNGKEGKYAFEDVSSGKYYIVFTPSNQDYYFVNPNEGNSDADDSDVTEQIRAGATNIFTVTNGVEEIDIDAGVYLSATIGNYVWEDTNQNGIQDPTEGGYAGVTVELYSATGNLVQTQESDINGSYLFDGIQPGDYIVRFVTAGSVAITEQSVGNDQTRDSDANSAGLTDIFTIEHGISNLQIDAGVHSTVALITGRAWLDHNENGSQDFGEEGMEGIEVELLDDDGNLVDRLSSDLLGNYTFADLDLDRYIIRFVQPGGYEFSESQFFISDEENSDVNENGMTPILNLAVNATRYHIDAGLISTSLAAQNYTVKIYPNPAVNSVQLSIDGTTTEDKEAIITVYDQMGRQVIEDVIEMGGNRTTRLDISQLRSGIYQVYIDSNGRLARQSLIVID